MSFSHTGTTGHTPSDLSSILRRVKATLHDTRLQAQHLPSLPARDESDSSYRDASLDDLKEAFGACQTIEWKEQEYRYIRSKVIGHRRRDMVHGCRPPAVHKLLRSVSTPEAPQVESRSYKTFLRHRRESLALGTQSAAACGCGKPQRTAADRDDLCEFSGEVCDKILLYVKSNAWASRESLLSATSRSLASSDDLDDPSVAVDARDHIVAVDARDPSVAVDARDPSVAVDARDPSVDVDVGDPSVDVDVGGPSVAVDADNPSVAVDADNPSVAVDADNPNVAVDNNPSLTVGACDPSVSNIVDACHPGASTPITAAVTSILDNIPHIDSDDDDDDCQGDCVVASEVPSTNNVVQVVEKFSPELPPLCEPEDDLCEDDQCEDDHQVAQAQPAVVLNQTQHNEGAYKGVEAPGLDPSYAHGQLSCHAHPSSHAHSSCHAHSSSHAHSSCHAHDAFFDVSGYAHRQFSWQTRCHSSTQSHTQPPSHAHSQSSNHAHSQVSSHAHTHVINDEPSQVCEDDNHTSMNEATVAITGGFSRDGWAVAEVVMGGSGEMEAWLGQCCDPAHPHALPRPPHTPLLLLLHAHALHASPPLLHALKERVWGAGVHVCVVKPTPTARSIRRLITNSELQVELVSEEQLHERVPEDQLTPQFGGTLQLDHHAWSVFCKIRVEVLDQVRRGATMLETCVSLSPSPSLSPPHSLAPSTTTEVQEMHHCVASAKSSLRHMEKWCHRLHNHSLVRCWMSECEELVKTLEAVSSLAMDHRASRLSLLHQEANSVVTWLLGRGEETLARHQTLADTLTGVTRQEAEFLKFHSVAMRHLEKGGALLEEAATVGETEASVKELARALHLHLTQFTDRLHHTRDRLEDTARCYHLLDKAYEWALEAMKVVGRVKGEGLASPEQVGAAGRTLTAYLEQHPPIPDDTFTAMTTLATRLNNHTLLQQCKMAQVRCQETNELLRNRQAALYKAKRQMEFDCQSFVDLGEVFGGGGGGEEMSPLAWLACSPLNVSGRRRSVSSLGSRPRDSLSRCPSLDTDDDSVFLDPPPPPAPAKTPLEPRTSLGGIKEVRESAEDLEQPSTPGNTKLTSPSGTTTSSSGSSGRCGSSSCSSSESSGPVSINKKFMKRANTWQYGLIPKGHTDDNTGMDDGVPLSPTSHKSIPPSSAVNSHLLIRGSQLNLSINMDDLSQEEVKKSKTLLLTMRELIQTERDYVNSLEYIIENYIPELMREDIPQALRGQRNVVFGNIEKIYEFHSGYFLRALEACEMRPFAVGSIFLRYESQFYLYALYNKNKPKSDSLMSEYGSAFFRKKQLELEDRMDLASYLLKPVQRMGKYALILKQLLKECGRGEENYDEIQGAQEMVQFQLRHGNDLLAMDSLRDCDVNLKEQGRLLRQGEFVVWEGSRAKKSVRHVFLFEDLILFSKARRDPEKKALDIFQYKHSMKMTDIGLTEQVSVSTTKFEIWFRKRKPSDTYLFQAPSAEMKEAWTEEISKLLWRQALRNRTMRLHEMSSMGIGNKPCLDIRPSEDQISDRSISINQLNKAPRLRTGSTSAIGDLNGGVGKRPHSIISVSSSSASSSASSASSSHSSTVCPTYVGALNLGFEAGNSPRPLHRSVTRTSQCSAESGILADMYSGGDDDAQSHRRVERSNSTVTTVSVDSALSPVSSCSPVFPVAPTSPSLIMVSPTRPTDVIYETQSVTPTVKDSSAKMLLTTEHHGESAPPQQPIHSSISNAS